MFRKTKRKEGSCRYRARATRSRIEYARHYVVELADLHEIAHRFFVWTPRFVYPCLCLAVPGLVALWRRAGFRGLLFLGGWLAFSLAGVCPGFFFRPHYYVVLLPALTVLTGAGVVAMGQHFMDRRQRVLAAAPVAFVVLMAARNVYLDRVLYFEASPDEACKRIYGRNPFVEALPIAAYIRAHAAEESRIAVLGSEPEIYFYAHRHSATGYLYTIALMEPQPYALQMQQEMVGEVESNAPEYVVWVQCPDSWGIRDKSPLYIFDWWEKYLPAHYEQVGTVELKPPLGSDIRWDDAARDHVPTAALYVCVYKRKS